MLNSGEFRAAVALWLFGSTAALAQVRLATQRIGQPNDFANPVGVTQPPGETHRLYVIGHSGPVWVVRDGVTQATPFLDITAMIGGGGSSESGFLGLAFHPQFQTNGYVYACYNTPSAIVIRRFTTDPASPDTIIPGVVYPIFSVARSVGIHNGGWTAFGPDGYLYFTLGETGIGPLSQDLTSLFGKMLRIDVEHDDFPADPTTNYAVPPTNPFAASPTAAHEIWAYGLRNPWRDSFDRQTGDLWIGDVGGSDRGEVDFQPAATSPPFTARNYGWPCMDGLRCNGNTTGCTCGSASLTNPIYDEAGEGGAIIGGYVYRGSAIPQFRGTYLFADLDGESWSFRYDGSSISEFSTRTGELPRAPWSAFGEDTQGELYLCSIDGPVYKIVPGCYPNCDNSTSAPALNVNDFVCFLARFAAGSPYANCDASTTPPVLNVDDFVCFQQRFAAGCP